MLAAVELVTDKGAKRFINANFREHDIDAIVERTRTVLDLTLADPDIRSL